MTIKRVVRFGLLIAWLALTVFLSEQSGVDSARVSSRLTDYVIKIFRLDVSRHSLEDFLRNLAHFGIHFVLAILAYRAFLTVSTQKPSILISLIICTAIALFDELTQQRIAGRAKELNDLLLNLFGVSLGVNISYLVSKPLQTQKPSQK